MRRRAARLLIAWVVGAVPCVAAAQNVSVRDTGLVRARVQRAEPLGLVWPRVHPQQTPGQVGGQSLNPDISVIGEFLADLSTGEPKTTTEGERFEVREVELAIQSVVDPFFRADFFLGLHPDGIEIEEAFLTALVLPGGLQARLGRFRVPLGKVNLIHRPEQITVDYPWVLRHFFGDEGLVSNGVTLSRIFAPFGFFQEILVYGISSLGRHEHEHEEALDEEEVIEVINAGRLRNQIAVGAQLRNFWDLSSAANLELGFSAVTGRVRELDSECLPGGPCPPVIVREVFEDQSYYGPYLTLRWRPLRQGLHRSLIWNNELLVNVGHDANRLGVFSQAQWQLSRRTYIGARFDAVEILDEEFPDLVVEDWFSAVSGYFTFFPSEFSRFKLALERTFGAGPLAQQWRAVLQTTFAIGPHRPHAF
ncbi:MAG: hypothetical protein ACRENP_19710 [Longimicrobiales bacterium]